MNLSVHPAADSEASQAAAWYEQKQSGLGLSFLNDPDDAFREIRRSALSLPFYEAIPSNAQIRRCRLRRFPYVVIFESNGDEAMVLAIVHSSQRPGDWLNRI